VIREKRLSPRRARSLAFLFLLGRTQGSPKTTPHPPAASADRRHTERETPRFCTLVLDARLHSARLAAVVRLSPTARLQRKSTVCGLSGLRPDFAGSPPIKSSTRLGMPCGSCAGVSLRRVNRRTAVAGLERKIAMRTNFSLQLGNRRIPGENQREQSLAQSRRRGATASNTKIN
jgi:hypothetical protein